MSFRLRLLIKSEIIQDRSLHFYSFLSSFLKIHILLFQFFFLVRFDHFPNSSLQILLHWINYFTTADRNTPGSNFDFWSHVILIVVINFDIVGQKYQTKCQNCEFTHAELIDSKITKSWYYLYTISSKQSKILSMQKSRILFLSLFHMILQGFSICRTIVYRQLQ